MMMNYNLKAIDIYSRLEFGQKVYDTISENIVSIDPRANVDKNLLEFFKMGEYMDNIVNPIQVIHDDKLIPLLFPITSLSEEIEINGNRIIPIIELAKLEDGDSENWYLTSNKECWKGTEWNDHYEFSYNKKSGSFYKQYVQGSYYIIGGTDNTELHINCQSDLYLWMDMHFIDHRGLISLGLSGNTLDYNNPYK